MSKPTQPRLTRARALAACACYSKRKLYRIVPAKGLTLREVTELEIPNHDKIWALSNACDWSEGEEIWQAVYGIVRERLSRETPANYEPLPHTDLRIDLYDVARAAANAHLLHVARTWKRV